MAWTYHTSRQHHRRKKPTPNCVRPQQTFRLSKFQWINNLVVVFICLLLFVQCTSTAIAEVRISYIAYAVYKIEYQKNGMFESMIIR